MRTMCRFLYTHLYFANKFHYYYFPQKLITIFVLVRIKFQKIPTICYNMLKYSYFPNVAVLRKLCCPIINFPIWYRSPLPLYYIVYIHIDNEYTRKILCKMKFHNLSMKPKNNPNFWRIFSLNYLHNK